MKCKLVLCLMLALSSMLFAQDIVWNVASGDWNVPGNWDLGVTPGSSNVYDYAVYPKILNYGVCNLNSNANESGDYWFERVWVQSSILNIGANGTLKTANMYISSWPAEGDPSTIVTQNGGTVETETVLSLGSGQRCDATYNMNGGTLKVGKNFLMAERVYYRMDGYSTLNLTDGLITVGDGDNGSLIFGNGTGNIDGSDKGYKHCTVNHSGGMLWIKANNPGYGNLSFGENVYDIGVYNISGGTLIVEGDIEIDLNVWETYPEFNIIGDDAIIECQGSLLCSPKTRINYTIDGPNVTAIDCNDISLNGTINFELDGYTPTLGSQYTIMTSVNGISDNGVIVDSSDADMWSVAIVGNDLIALYGPSYAEWGSNSGQWSVASNWIDSTKPTSMMAAKIRTSTTCTLDETSTITNLFVNDGATLLLNSSNASLDCQHIYMGLTGDGNYLNIDSGSGVAQLQIDGGSLSASGNALIADGDGSDVSVSISGGAFNVGKRLQLASAAYHQYANVDFDITGGNVNVGLTDGYLVCGKLAGELSPGYSTISINQSGGTLNIYTNASDENGDMILSNTYYDDSSYTISGGTLNVGGDLIVHSYYGTSPEFIVDGSSSIINVAGNLEAYRMTNDNTCQVTIGCVIDAGGVSTINVGGQALFANLSRIQVDIEDGVTLTDGQEFTFITAAAGISDGGMGVVGACEHFTASVISGIEGDPDSLVLTYHQDSDPDRCTNTCIVQPEGDLNNDCKVNIADLSIIAESWLQCGLDLQRYCD